MSDYQSQIDELQSEAWGLPNCPTKVSLLEEAVRVADLHNDVEQAYDLRQDLMESATFSGRDDVLLVAFSWCLAQFDRDPERFDQWDLFWKYKWVVGNVPDFPTISRPQIEELLADMQRRFDAAGYSQHAVHQKRRDVMCSLRDLPAATAAHEQFSRVRRDMLSDCPACVECNTGDYYELLGEWDSVWRAYAQIAEGRLTCHVEPLRSTSHALVPLLRLGQRERAEGLQKKVSRLLAKSENPNRAAAEHVIFLAVIGETARAKRLFERYLPAAVSAISYFDRFDMLRAGIILLDRLAEKGPTVKMQLPAPLPPADEKGRREIAPLRAWFLQESQQIAQQFDARNQNDGHTQALQRLPELLELDQP